MLPDLELPKAYSEWKQDVPFLGKSPKIPNMSSIFWLLSNTGIL